MLSSINSDSAQLKTLPFPLNEKAFGQWLSHLSTTDQIEQLKSVSSVLTTLRQTKLPVNLRLLFLKQISPVANKLCQQLEKSYLKSHFPFSKQHQNIIESSIQAYTSIAKNHRMVCEDSSFNDDNIFSQQDKLFILCHGLEAQAKVIFYTALLYKKPEKGFWSLCFLFYLFAKQNNILEIPFTKQNIQFIQIFKHILIFELSNTQQFNAEEISTIFYLIKESADKVSLSNSAPDKKFRGLPFLNLRKDYPPSRPKDHPTQDNPYLFYISCLELIKHLMRLSTHTNNTNTYSKPMLLRLIKTLTMNQQRNNEREPGNDELFCIIGFDHVQKFLLNNQQDKQNNAVKPGELAELDFDIVPIEKRITDFQIESFRTEREANLTIATRSDAFEQINNDDIWSSSPKKLKQQKNIKAANADIIDQSSTGFRLSLKDKNTTTQVGDIIGLMIADDIIISIIRRIILVQENKIQIGIEKLGEHAKFLYLPNSTGVIYLHDDHTEESLIIRSSDYNNDDCFFLTKDTRLQRYKIKKQLSASSIIRHFKINLS